MPFKPDQGETENNQDRRKPRIRTEDIFSPPFSGSMGIVLTVGTGERYCAVFGGQQVKNDSTLTKRKNAAIPGACP